MGVSRRARKRTNRGHSENKDKMWVKKQTKNKQKKHIGALGRSFVPLFRRSVACLYRFFVPLPSSVALRLLVGKNSFFLSYISKPSFSHIYITREVSRYLGWKGRAFWLFFVCKGGCYFSILFFTSY